MLAGLVLPGRPVGNMYFAAWSHTVVANAVNLCSDLKMGEYREIDLFDSWFDRKKKLTN